MSRSVPPLQSTATVQSHVPELSASSLEELVKELVADVKGFKLDSNMLRPESIVGKHDLDASTASTASKLEGPVDFNSQLKEDVRLLTSMAVQIIKSHSGVAGGTPDRLATIIEGILAASMLYSHDKNDESFEALITLIRQLKNGADFLEVGRVMLEMLTLTEIAERQHRLRRWRGYRRGESDLHFRHTMRDAFSTLLQHNVSKEAIRESLMNQQVELVLTAHPTQASRRTLLAKYFAIAELLDIRDKTKLTPEETKAVHEDIRREILSAWRSSTIRRLKLTPEDEARNGLGVLETVIWNSFPGFLRTIDANLESMGIEPLPPSKSLVTFGSWIGGDRDGNPFVTHALTAEVIKFYRWRAASLLYQEVDALLFELSLTHCSEELRNHAESIRSDVTEIYKTYTPTHLYFSKGNIPRDECYRLVLAPVREKLKATTAYWENAIGRREIPPPEAAGIILTVKELMDPLLLCYRSLVECGDKIIADGRLTDLIRRISAFGLSLVKLDIRQESDMHAKTLDSITKWLNLGSYQEWSEEKRQEFLVAELQSRRPLVPPEWPEKVDDSESIDPMVKEVMATFRTLAVVGADSLGAYIISMAHSPSDVLAVELLQKTAGIKNPMRVVPLFETRADLERASQTMESLFKIPFYLKHIAQHHNRGQEVMLGYSDSAKDAGRLTSVWTLFTAQEELVKTFQKYQVQLTIFHGRGGSVGRGGGPQHLAVLSQPSGSVMGRMRVTIQGEIIDQHFALVGTAQQTLERYTNAVLLSTLLSQEEPKGEWRSLMAVMSDVSCAHYRKIVFETPEFAEYFRQTTPIGELGLMHIGSRPQKRRAGGIESLRAIPWVFAMTQVRSHVPVWLGIAPALQYAIDNGHEDTLKEMYTEWKFFRSTIDLAQMVLAKADVKINEYYDKRLARPELVKMGDLLRKELADCNRLVLRITQQDRLLVREPVVARAIETRLPFTDPLNLLQVESLRRVRSILEQREQGIASNDEGEDQLFVDALLITIQGIASGMGNTG